MFYTYDMAQDARTIEEASSEKRAQVLGIDYIDTSKIPKRIYKNILSVPELYELRAIPIIADEHHIHFGVTNTTSQQTLNGLRERFTDQRLSFSLISETGFKEYMRLYDPPKAVHYEDIDINAGESGTDGLIEEVSATLESVRPDDMLAYLVSQAYGLSASDIHLETMRERVRVRFRVDGVLHPVAYISKEKYLHLTSSLASAADISTSAREAQTGHISRTYKMATGEDVTLNLRVESVQTVYGMDIVMRLFNMNLEFFKLENLGLSKAEAELVDDVISHPTGLVLVVGPTGSGKTTTLYSLINTLNTPERKIVTLEDPVEYNLPGVVQIPVEGGIDRQDFAEKLRAVLRLDPDVVMVGEIRDPDTAKTALQAALTGHLVLSTFHAANASAALTRLLDMVGPNPLFTSAIHLVMAQRLVRRLANNKQAYTPDDSMANAVKQTLTTLPPDIQRPETDNLKLYRAVRTNDNPFGYKGQLAIREQMVMTPGVRQLLKQPASQVTVAALEAQAVHEGMVTMKQDGIMKAIAGLTSIEEIYRVVD